MKRHAKAASAGSTSSRGIRLGSVRRAFATRGDFSEADGSSAPSVPARPRLLFAAASAALALCLLVAPAAWANGTVNVTVVGSGSGVVTSTAEQFFGPFPEGPAGVSPAQIKCSKTAAPPNNICSASFTNNTGFGGDVVKVTLTATPDSGGGPFIGWVQADGTTSSRCTLPPQATPTCEITLTGSPSPTAGVFAVFGTPPAPPSAATLGSSAGAAGHLATLEGSVNPNNLAVLGCSFVYGKTTAYGRSTSCQPSAGALGSGSSAVAVTATTAPLQPNTIYHFRLRASNIGGTGQGKDRTFTTGPAPADSCPNADIRAEQGIEVQLLPDCMALEQVSPSAKGNQHARASAGFSGVSADGSRVLYNSPATLTTAPNRNALGGDLYIGTRGTSGWTTESESPSIAISGFLGTSLTPDFSSWIWPSREGFYGMGLGGQIAPLSAKLKNLTSSGLLSLLGASADHSHVYLEAEGASSESGAPRTGSYLPGDPLPEGVGEDFDVYVTQIDSEGNPSLELLARDRDGKVWGAKCGARLGGMENITGINLNLQNGPRNQGAISADGSRVYFSTRPSQPPSGNCTEANKKRIMVREETPTGPKIEELIASECDRVSPPCSTTDGDDAYQGASVDQSKVYFTTSRQLADTDLDGSATSCDNITVVPGCDLYLYDSDRPAGERLTQVSAGDETAATPGSGASVNNGITGISADGSHVYFVAQSVLTTDPNPQGAVAQAGQFNLYLYTYPQGETAFIGTLNSVDACIGCGGGGKLFDPRLRGGGSTWTNDAYPVPITGTDAQGNEVGGDGHILLFRSTAPLTPDDTDSARDIYRYDADAGTLERVSVAGPGGADNGAFDVVDASSGSTGTDYAEKGRWVSEDGETVVFATNEALLPGDVNGVEDAYMWREGQIFHLPGSARSSTTLRANAPSLSHDGSEVLFHSTEQLLPTDGDSVQDVYVVRADGGYRPQIRSICNGEACQGAPVTLSDEIGATSGSLVSSGNVKSQGAQSRRCPKGKHRVRRKGKPRCVSGTAHKKNAAKKQASRKQGGQK